MSNKGKKRSESPKNKEKIKYQKIDREKFKMSKKPLKNLENLNK